MLFIPAITYISLLEETAGQLWNYSFMGCHASRFPAGINDKAWK